MFYQIFQHIAEASQRRQDRQLYGQVRRQWLQKISQLNTSNQSQTLVKQAFDTRRIDQNTQYNPRRNLQYHVRQDPFINDEDMPKVEALFKLKQASDLIKEAFLGEPEWFDSYASDLDHILHKTFFKADGKNLDIAPAHLLYLEQLLQDRYRLKLAEVANKTTDQLKTIIIHKDEHLEKSAIYQSGTLSKRNAVKQITQNADDIWSVSQSIVSYEKQLDELRSDELSLQHRLSQKQSELQELQQDQHKYANAIANIQQRQQPVLKKLWATYNDLQKVIASKKGMEGLISVNANYQEEGSKLCTAITQDINTLTKIMHTERPIYDALETDKLQAQQSLKDRQQRAEVLSQETAQLKIKHSQLNQQILQLKEQLHHSFNKINQLRNKGD